MLPYLHYSTGMRPRKAFILAHVLGAKIANFDFSLIPIQRLKNMLMHLFGGDKFLLQIVMIIILCVCDINSCLNKMSTYFALFYD